MRRDLVAVTGASGFVGGHLIRSLREAGWPVRAIVHSAGDLSRMRSTGSEAVPAEVRDRRSLGEALTGCRAVIHLVAIIRESGSETYHSVNVEGAANVAAAARTAGLDRLIHVSALGAGPSSTRYLRSKWAGEEEIRRAGIPSVILRPSFIIAAGGGAAAQFADVVRYGPWYPFKLLIGWDRLFAALAVAAPVLPILGPGGARYMPVDLRDIWDVVRQAIERSDVLGDTFEIGGPDEVTYDQIMGIVAQVLGVRRWKLHLPPAAARVIVQAFGVLPNPPVTRDEFETLLRDNVCDNTKVVRTFGLALRPFAESIRDALRIKTAEELER